MNKLTRKNTVNPGDFIYVPISGFILEVSKNKIKAGKYTLATTVNQMLIEEIDIYIFEL